jgi:hypothetical protein
MFYIFVSGILLLAAPNFVITLVGFKLTQEPCIYAIGLLALSLCFCYLEIARSGSPRAVIGTVYGRWFFTGIAPLPHYLV